MNFIKKRWWILLIGLILIIGGLFMIFNNPKEIKYDNIIEINITDLENKIQSKETFILILTQTGCGHCEKFLPEFNSLLKKYNIMAFDLNTTNLKKEDLNILHKYINFSGTPTTIFFNDGEEKTSLNRIVGYTSKSKAEQRLKAMGFIE